MQMSNFEIVVLKVVEVLSATLDVMHPKAGAFLLAAMNDRSTRDKLDLKRSE